MDAAAGSESDVDKRVQASDLIGEYRCIRLAVVGILDDTPVDWRALSATLSVLVTPAVDPSQNYAICHEDFAQP
jgi:hypothetical protein